MADSTDKNKEDELAGTEQPFVQHLMELRDRLLYCVYGLVVAGVLLAIWPGPAGPGQKASSAAATARP